MSFYFLKGFCPLNSFFMITDIQKSNETLLAYNCFCNLLSNIFLKSTQIKQKT